MSYLPYIERFYDQTPLREDDSFEEAYAREEVVGRHLFVAHRCQSEVNNGGWDQFFTNSTGVIGPEAVEAFEAIGMPKTARVICEAISLLGEPYPRARGLREKVLMRLYNIWKKDREEPLESLDQRFFSLIYTENGGFEQCAVNYLTTHLGQDLEKNTPHAPTSLVRRTL